MHGLVAPVEPLGDLGRAGDDDEGAVAGPDDHLLLDAHPVTLPHLFA